jgi:hypothetical protein
VTYPNNSQLAARLRAVADEQNDPEEGPVRAAVLRLAAGYIAHMPTPVLPQPPGLPLAPWDNPDAPLPAPPEGGQPMQQQEGAL